MGTGESYAFKNQKHQVMKPPIKLLLLVPLFSICAVLSYAQQLKSGNTKPLYNKQQTYYRSWRMYDSLGYEYLFAGDTATAIYNYGKAVELHPNNTSTSKTMERLQYYYLKSGKFYVEDN